MGMVQEDLQFFEAREDQGLEEEERVGRRQHLQLIGRVASMPSHASLALLLRHFLLAAEVADFGGISALQRACAAARSGAVRAALLLEEGVCPSCTILMYLTVA